MICLAGTDLSINSKRGEISDHLLANNQTKHTAISFIWNTHPSRSADMMALAELPCMNMYVSWMYPCYRSSEPVPGSFDKYSLCSDFWNTRKNIQVFLLERYPSKWGELAAMIQEELARAQKGQGWCWQLGLRRQKGWNKLLFPPLFSFSFCYEKDGALFGGSVHWVFSTCFDL